LRTSAILAIFVFAACGDDGKATQVDAPIQGQTIKISGNAKDAVSMAVLAGVAITANKTSDDSVVATTMTAADGTYSLTVPFDGTSLDGYVKATVADYADTYLFPPAPLAADFDAAAVNMITPAILTFLYGQGGVTQDTSKGTITMETVTATGGLVAGVMVAASPATGTIKYGNPPSKTAVMTPGDGIASVLNAPIGTVMLSATAGGTFHAHPVKTFAGAFTTTLLSE
jgi:hypothetical protein